jgi:hypothetical protein
MRATLATARLKVADEVWVAVALLHREHPEQPDFALDEIMARAAREAGKEPLRPGVYVHVVQHCVANRAPNPGRYRMLYETAPGRRRLFRKGDTYHPGREGAKTTPDNDDMPQQYRDLLDWYRGWEAAANAKRIEDDPLLALRNIGKGLWTGVDPDEYVRQLREGWE